MIYNAHKTYFHDETPKAVQEALEYVRQKGVRVRLFLGDKETGRCWMEEHNIMGYVSRSMGPQHIPILLFNRRSDGGGGILTHCIVRLDTTDGRTLYQHPNFHIPEMTITPSDLPEYIENVVVEGEVHARFMFPGQAESWVRFMQGKCYRT